MRPRTRRITSPIRASSLPRSKKLDRLDVDPRAVTYVGDSIKDFLAARDAGLGFVGVLRGTTRASEFAAAGATTVESLDALLERF